MSHVNIMPCLIHIRKVYTVWPARSPLSPDYLSFLTIKLSIMNRRRGMGLAGHTSVYAKLGAHEGKERTSKIIEK